MITKNEDAKQLLQDICEMCRTDINDLSGRQNEKVQAIQLFCYAMARHSNFNYDSIGEFVGKSRRMVFYNVKGGRERVSNNVIDRKFMRDIEDRIAMRKINDMRAFVDTAIDETERTLKQLKAFRESLVPG